ncbi:hypothetical protein [Demequina silvatica]|uniref:hypothetical protein n=1 Tax=Demequina silvatica TaxID=1638988 RepID=UPI0007864B95|nr:hypothetical protein [Demequina silvatica]
MRHITPLRLDRVSRTVGRGDAAERLARARVAALSVVEHPGVCAPLDVVREDDAVVALSPRVAGAPLATAGRAASVGEWVWLVAGVAEALDALHSHGLAHGDVSPSNVLVGVRPVLVDLVGPALGGERGTPGFAAPERAAGGPPTAAGDVHALGAVALAAASPAFRTEAEAWMAPLLDPDPDARPSARAVARGIVGCATPARWRLELADPPPQPAARSVRTERDPRAWHWRLRRHPSRLVAVAAAGALTAGWMLWGPVPVAVAPVVGVGVAGAGEARTGAADRAKATAASSLPPPAEAARELTRERIEAIAAGDGDALVELTVPGSRAWATAAREARQFGEVEVRGLAVEVGDATVVRGDGTSITVEVAYTLAAHTLVDGRERTEVPEQRQVARLALVWSGERWRVERVSVPP